MANPYLILWCDPAQNKIYSGWQKAAQALPPVLKQGDQIGVEIHWVKSGLYSQAMQEIQFPPSATVRLAVGRLDSAPTGGTFTITYGANTTAPLAYGITATELETALNDLASITSDGGVTVSKTGNQFRIVWNDVGAYTTALTSDVDMLYPTSQASVVESRAGSLDASRIILFKVRQSAIAALTSFTAVAQPSITVSSLFTSTWRVSISPMPKEGVFSLTVIKGPSTYTTISMSATADAFTMASALNSLNVVSGQKFNVIKSGDFTWDITAPTAVDSISATSGLVGFSAMYGVLDMNTAEVEEFLSGSSSGTATIEVEVDVAGEIQTLAQTGVRVLNDLIDQSSFNIVSMGSLMPVDSVVRYDTSQALTVPQQETARQNINAVSLAEVTDSLDLTNLPTLNEKKAMQYSVLPSQTNPFVTMTERNPFDQELNTTDDVQFNTVTVGTNTVVIDGNSIEVSEGANTLTIQPTGITFPDSSVQTAAFNSSLYLTKAGNLSGLASASAARTNLGLGTMAVEPAANYLAKADNLGGLASVSTARTNLGLGTMATETATNYLAKSGNLSGLASTVTARSNIGLGQGDNVQFAGATVSSVTFSGNSSVQTIAGPSAPSDTSLPHIVSWNGSNAFVCGWNAGQLYVDQGSSYQARFGSYSGEYGSGAIEITEDNWATSMELNARGLKFPDGTTQTSASNAPTRSIDFTSYSWTAFLTGTGTASQAYMTKGVLATIGGDSALEFDPAFEAILNGDNLMSRKWSHTFQMGYTAPFENIIFGYGFKTLQSGTTPKSDYLIGVYYSAGSSSPTYTLYVSYLTPLGYSIVPTTYTLPSALTATYIKISCEGNGEVRVYANGNEVFSATDAVTSSLQNYMFIYAEHNAAQGTSGASFSIAAPIFDVY